jgi:hypothetical protein
VLKDGSTFITHGYCTETILYAVLLSLEGLALWLLRNTEHTAFLSTLSISDFSTIAGVSLHDIIIIIIIIIAKCNRYTGLGRPLGLQEFEAPQNF